MNTTTNPNLDSQFDRLIDGELSPAEYRALLASLDDQPDGWRRCALAFLEAQALKQDFSALRQPVATGATSPAAMPADAMPSPPDRPGDWSHRTWQGLYFATLAASLALAFYVGSWTSNLGDPSAGPSFAQISEPGADSRGDLEPEQTAETGRGPSVTPPRAVARSEQPLGNVRLVIDGAEQQRAVDVPVYDQQQLDQWRTTNKPVLSPQVVEQLRRAGHKVNHQQQYILLETEGGDQVVVPVDGYQIQPPRRQAY